MVRRPWLACAAMSLLLTFAGCGSGQHAKQPHFSNGPLQNALLGRLLRTPVPGFDEGVGAGCRPVGSHLDALGFGTHFICREAYARPGHHGTPRAVIVTYTVSVNGRGCWTASRERPVHARMFPARETGCGLHSVD